VDNIIKNQTEKVKELESRIEGLEAKVEILKEVIMETKAKSFKFYSEEETKALLDALTGVPLGPQVMKTCQRLVELGWNDRFDQKRTPSGLRSKYLRLIGEK
jgi:vacuolar-type H+-ATPase subunit I/STV1